MFKSRQIQQEVTPEPQDYYPELQQYVTRYMARKDYDAWIKIVFGVLNSWGEGHARVIAQWIGEEKQGEYEKLFKSYKGHSNPATIATLFKDFQDAQPQLFAEMQRNAHSRARDRLANNDIVVIPKSTTAKQRDAVAEYKKKKTTRVKRELKTIASATDQYGRVLYPVTCNDVIADKDMPKGHNNFWFSWWLPLQRLGRGVQGDRQDTHNLEWRICAGAGHCFTVFADQHGDVLTQPHERRAGRLTGRRNELSAYGRLFAVDIDKTDRDIAEHVQYHLDKAGEEACKPICAYHSASNAPLLKKYRFRLLFDFGKVLDYRDDYTREHAQETIARTIEQYAGDTATKDLARVWFGNSKETQLHIF